MIHLKTEKQIADMAEGGKRLRYVLDKTLEQVRPGVSTYEIDQFADSFIKKQGGESGFKRIDGYKWATCMCVNDCIVHGVPKKDEILNENDVVTVDIGMFYRGLNTDTSWTVRVKSLPDIKSTDPKILQIDYFLEVGKRALNKAIKQVKLGKYIGNISTAIQETIEAEGYGISDELIGHGIGKDLHEDPNIPGLLNEAIEKTPKLKIGMTLAIETIYMMGQNDVYVDKADGWTIRTGDGTIASCFEKTVALTNSGVAILT